MSALVYSSKFFSKVATVRLMSSCYMYPLFCSAVGGRGGRGGVRWLARRLGHGCLR
jgi:hypothetical protein